MKHPDNAALKNLQEQKSNFQAVNSKYDPLLEALGKSGQKSNCDPIPEAIGDLNERPVNSRAGARKTRSMTAQ